MGESLQNAKLDPSDVILEIRKRIKKKIDYFNSISELKNQQKVHTSFELCKEMVGKLVEFTNLKGKYILTLNLEFVEILCYDYGVEKKNIWFITDCQKKADVLKHPRFKGVNVAIGNYLLTECKNMKFDVIVGNPPYQIESDNKGQTHPVWNKFVLKSFSLLIDGGYLCMIHPNGWRDVKGMFEDIKNTLLSKNVKYLEMHDMNDGVKIFGVQSNYDWYVIQNSPSEHIPTFIKGQDGSTYSIDISKLKFIPSRMFDEIMSLVAKDGEEKVELLADCSYHHSLEHMLNRKKGKFKYPCIYSIKMGDIPTLHYSSTDKKGHFGIPKFIWGNGVCTSIGSIVDETGKYGLTQFACAILDRKENLPLIKKAFDSDKFKELMKACPNQNNNINRKVISLFRKDFWKNFVDENGNELK